MTVFAVIPDKSVDCAGRPRWDKFIVDEETTDWNPETAGCFGEIKEEIDYSKMYGSPKMYGEFEGMASHEYRNALPNGSFQNKSYVNTMYGKYEPEKIKVK